MGHGGYRIGSGRKKLSMDDQTRLYYDQYNMQRLHAGYRGIEWHFTFESWLDWWGDDIDKRGRSNGQLVMARYGDQGDYHPNNVRKATRNDNNREIRKGKPVNTPKGTFASLTDAAYEYGLSVEAIRHRIKSRPNEYSYN